MCGFRRFSAHGSIARWAGGFSLQAKAIYQLSGFGKNSFTSSS
jgi:hypothetical protein